MLSSFTPWENPALIMEALGVTAQKCLDEGLDRKQVYEAIEGYLKKALDGYKLLL